MRARRDVHFRGTTRGSQYLRALIAVGSVAVLLCAGGASPATAATTTKPYLTTVTPSSVGAGSVTAFVLSIRNDANPQQLGSANVTVPSGFTLLTVDQPTS